MQRRIDLIRGLARRLPGTDGLAGAAAASGDPAPLLELQARRTATAARGGGVTDAAAGRDAARHA
jgi:hypothetical protein